MPPPPACEAVMNSRAIVLPMGDDAVAIGVDAVREVVVAPQITPLPTAPPAVLGLFNLRGSIVPVLDTSRLLDRSPLATIAYTVVVRCRNEDAALVASGVPVMASLGPLV